VWKACEDDAALRADVEAMLKEAERADSFFGPGEARDSPAIPVRESVGQLIGRYKLLEKIGKGAWASFTWPSNANRWFARLR
jgi:hypothetical protein